MEPLDVRSVGISILAVVALILLFNYAQEVFIPFVLSGVLFYALDPIVDWLQKLWIPRALDAAVVVLTVANDLFTRKLIKNFGATLSKKKITVQIVDQISAQIARFLLVQLTTRVVVAVVTGLALWWLGLRQAAFWGILLAVPMMMMVKAVCDHVEDLKPLGDFLGD